MKSRIIITVISIVILIGIIMTFSSLSDNKEEPKFVQYDTDASDSTHYSFNETIKVGKSNFIINGYELIEIDNLRNYILTAEIDKNSYEILQSQYTFMLASEDNLWKKSSCSYEDNTIRIVEIERNPITPNQFVVIDNSTFKIISTVNID